MDTPARSYLVCATPRSGSSFLCGLLKSTGIAGRPEEYFWRGDQEFWSRRWGVTEFPAYLRAALAEGSTANGVFGAKVMWGYLDDLVRKLRASAGPAHTDVELLRMAFPGATFVLLRRADVVAQAVSWARASLTQEWYRGDTRQPGRGAKFDFGLIDGLVHLVVDQNAAWQRWFDTQGVRPHVVRYEDLVVDPRGETEAILGFLGIDVTPELAIAPETSRQADQLNEEWIARYRALAG